MRKNIELSDQERIVISTLLRTGSNDEAARKAGYSRSSLKAVLARPRVKEELRRRRNDAMTRASMDLAYLLEQLQKIIEAPDGAEVGKVGNLAKGEHRFSEVSVAQTSNGRKYARPKTTVKGSTVKTSDRIAAIKEAGTLMGVRIEKKDHDVNARLEEILREEDDGEEA